MDINKLIAEVTEEYMPLKLETKNREVTCEESEMLFNLSTKLGLYKIVKSLFMEEFLKNQKLVNFLIDEGKLTTHIEKMIDEKNNNKEVEVRVIEQSMDDRISMIPDKFSQPIIEKLVKAHKENINLYEKGGKTTLLEKERYELMILESWLPKESTREDIMRWLSENYPEGISQKEMGPTIGKIKSAFTRVDGRLVSECVKSIIK